MSGRHLFFFIYLISPFGTACVRAQSSPDGYRATEYRPDVLVTMRDGVRLSANIYIPDGKGPFPVILRRTPYGSGDSSNADGLFFARHGYVFISQNTRGRYGSEGIFDAFRYEKDDGEDTHRWISAQSWFNGKLGTQGGSYVGFTQWMPAPTSKDLRAIFSWVSFSSLYEALYHGGAFYLDFAVNWSVDMTRPLRTPQNLSIDSLMRKLPLTQMDSSLGWKIPFLRDWIRHPQKDNFWNKTNIDQEHKNIGASVLNLGGWFDIFLQGTIDTHIKMATSPKKSAEQKHKLVIGPWQHTPGKQTSGELDFGKDALINIRQMQLHWFNSILKANESETDTLPPVRIFVMGKNEWRNENEWPLARTQYRPYFLSSSSGANSVWGDGTLKSVQQEKAGIDQFHYDPRDPVYMPHTTGPYDQSAVEKRTDVLVYSTTPLEKDMEVTGPVKMILYANSNVISTDFTAKLVDVHPDGKAIRICEGILRTYRPETNEQNLEPNRYEIDMWATSNVFLKGHSIRIEISSSNYPKYHPNSNTNIPFATATRVETALQTIHYGSGYASHILLPVIE